MAKKAKPKRAAPKKAATVTTRVPTEERNGIKQPREGGVCRAVWDALDSAIGKGEEVTSKSAREMAEKKGWNPNNVSIELSRWRKFNGIVVEKKAA